MPDRCQAYTGTSIQPPETPGRAAKRACDSSTPLVEASGAHPTHADAAPGLTRCPSKGQRQALDATPGRRRGGLRERGLVALASSADAGAGRRASPSAAAETPQRKGQGRRSGGAGLSRSAPRQSADDAQRRPPQRQQPPTPTPERGAQRASPAPGLAGFDAAAFCSGGLHPAASISAAAACALAILAPRPLPFGSLECGRHTTSCSTRPRTLHRLLSAARMLGCAAARRTVRSKGSAATLRALIQSHYQPFHPPIAPNIY